MTSILDARAELGAALTAAGVPAVASWGKVQPPCALVFGNGIDLTDRGHVARGQVAASFRVTVLGATWDDAAVPTAEHTAAVQLAIATIRGLAGWALTDARPDYVAGVAGGRYLAADVVASRMIDL